MVTAIGVIGTPSRERSIDRGAQFSRGAAGRSRQKRRYHSDAVGACTTVCAAFSIVIPAMPQIGNPGARRRTRSATCAKPATPIGGAGFSFEEVANTPPTPT